MVRHEEHIYDELLVISCQGGDRAALRELVSRWQTRLGRFASRQTGDSDAAKDVLQESWLAIVRGIRKLDDPAGFRAWAYRIVANKSADWIRRKQRTRAVTEELEKEPEQFAEQFGEGNIERQDDITRLRRALKLLPKDRRTILSLRYVDELSTREIAGILGVPEGTVKSRLYHAREELKHVLEKE